MRWSLSIGDPANRHRAEFCRIVLANTIRQNSARCRFAGSPMLKLQRIFKNYQETGSLNEQVNLYGFIDSNVFLTKTGDMGVVLEVRGVDFECLDGNALDGITKRLES